LRGCGSAVSFQKTKGQHDSEIAESLAPFPGWSSSILLLR
jgi:hypothetical protein